MNNTLGMTPLLKKGEIDILEKELESLYSRLQRPLSVLEWGSGGSTHHFTAFMDKKGIPYTWVSLEYNKKWFEQVSKSVADNVAVSMYLFDVRNDALKQRHVNMDEYVDFPKTLGKTFDLVFVDGRKRRRCVHVAKEILSPEGVVFLHDAQRPYYQCVFDLFSGSKLMGVSLWRGTDREENALLEDLLHIYWRFLQVFVFRPMYATKRYVSKKLRRKI